jgi:tRNA pseudouridine13 synthase
MVLGGGNRVAPVWPFLTADIAPVPATIKRRDEDFVVEEIPLYDPCGSGDHVYALIEKVGMTTRRAVLEIARAVGVSSTAIGVAGQKDARGITRQVLSIEGVEPSRVEGLDLPHLRVLGVARHRARLRPGALRGNRFRIRLRGVSAAQVGEVQQVLEVLARRGVPNYFGPQRFGMRGDTWEVGRALLVGDFTAAVALIAGRPTPDDSAPVRRARELTAAGRYAEAANAWPSGFADCARLCRLLTRTGGDIPRALFGLDRSVLGFYVSAYQSWLFNLVLAERVADLDQCLSGEIAFWHRTGRFVPVTDVAAAQLQATRFEISPTGPMFGVTMSRPQGEAWATEQRILADAGCALERLPRTGPLRCVGGRRPLRFQPEGLDLDSGEDGAGSYLEIGFTLPPGCYATALLREICKDRLHEGPAEPDVA